MFSCEGPLWQGDDFSECFKCDYLLTIFPLAACVVSFLLASWQAAASSLDAPTKHEYALLDEPNSHANGHAARDLNGVPVVPDHLNGEEEVSDDEEDVTEDGNLVVDVDKPRGEIPVLVLELTVLLGQVAVHVAILVTNSFNRGSGTAQYSRIITWSYVLVVAVARLLFTISHLESGPRLWYHAASLYGLQWFSNLWVFRGELIQRASGARLALVSTDFALSTILVVIVLSVRRGNQVIERVHDEKLLPSPESLASLFSLASFSWVDEIITLGYARTLEMPDVYDLPPVAKARRLVADFKTIGKTTRLTYRLMSFFKQDLLFQFFWISSSTILQFAPTLLLKAILEYVENPGGTTPSMAWLYVFCMPALGFAQGIGENFSLWRGRQVCIKLRALLVSEVYSKTLKRKTGVSDETNSEEKPDLGGTAPKTWKDRIASFFRPDTVTTSIKQAKHVSSGTIINLMSVDAFKVSEVCAYLPFLFPTTPIELALTVGLLWRTLGWSSVASIIIMIFLIPINAWFTRQFQRAQKLILACTDKRIHTTNEVLQNIRIVKFFAWEEKYMNSVNEKRREELGAMWYRFRVYAYASCFWTATPLVITGFSFFFYTVVEGKDLVPSVAFTALSLFSLLRFPLDRLTDMIARILEAKISIDRIESFLGEEETGKYEQLASVPHDSDPEDDFIGFKNATMSWGSQDEPVDAGNRAFRMINMNTRFVNGALNIIAGPTGSGKTSLLMALLGEMNLVGGSVHLPGGYVREKLRPRADGLTDSVAYCAQQAWLVNDTIKQNVLFASPFDKARYEAAIDACALRKDLEVLEAGDATLVGEKGIVVSGGQKQRISLARALYCNSRHVLLDDCLSAVDSHTAQHIYEKCINGPMMKGRTCILVTHNIALTMPSAKHMVLLENGKIKAQGLPSDLLKDGHLGESLDSKPGSRNNTRPNTRGGALEVTDTLGSDENANGSKPVSQPDGGKSKAFQDDVEDANKRVEGKSEGAVAWSVIKLYFSSMGRWWFPLAIIGGYVASNLGNIATNVWIRQWANSYSFKETASSLQVQSHETEAIGWKSNNGYTNANNIGNALAFLPSEFLGLIPHATSSSWKNRAWEVPILSSNIHHDTDVGYYLGVYAALGALYICLSLFQYGVLFWGSYRASKMLHGRLLESIMRAKFKFFDTTPLGQIVNRFSKDLQSIDLDIAAVAAGVLQSAVGALSTIILITIITPGFLIAAVFLIALYVAMAIYYVNSSRDLKRLEASNRSPLYQQFGETISGITTIRAYGDEQRFIRDNAGRINTHNRPFIYLWATNRWLALRIQWAGAMVSFFAAMFIVISVGKIDAGAAGVSLSYALTFNDSVLWLVRLYAENEQNMSHVERVKQYLDVEQEALARVPEHAPAHSWPDQGSVEFIDYSTRYRADLEPVLRGLNVKINGQEKVGIVGRTGAGKSSLALAVFRGLEADSGKIVIDGVDIGRIGLQDLREAITIVPQDPTLFTGTIRSNLDPFGLFTDEEIFTALRRVHLIGSPSRETSGHVTPQPSDATKTSSSTPQYPADPEQTTLIHKADDPNTSGADLSANISLVPPPVEPIVSDEADAAMDGLARVLTNSRENINVFHNLSSHVAESGSNLSQGQRQLLCLARALLKKPRVLVMDEATASIDYATDAKIQETLREIRDSTIITIAHRLKTIVDYDKVMVLDKGEIVEYGAPWELIERKDGNFRGLCESSGEFEVLLETAEKAKTARHNLHPASTFQSIQMFG